LMVVVVVVVLLLLLLWLLLLMHTCCVAWPTNVVLCRNYVIVIKLAHRA
jgi:hypothetical protein